MKVRGALRRMCLSCKIVRRGKKCFVICGADPKHKQRQGFATAAGAGAREAECAACGCGCGGAEAAGARATEMLAALPRAQMQ